MSNSPLEKKVETRLLTDILVTGKGLAAVTAALAARKQGKKVLLAAPTTTVASEITSALYGDTGEGASGFFKELIEKVADLGGLQKGWIDPAITEMVVDEMLSDYGVELLLYATPLALVPAVGGNAGGVIFGAKDGLFIISAGAILDATEHGALFSQSGVPFVPAAQAAGLRTLFFEFAGPGPIPGEVFEVEGFSCVMRRTWEDQVCLLMTGQARGDGDYYSELSQRSRLAIPAVAQAAIARCPALKDAVVSLSGHHLLTLKGDRLRTPSLQHPGFANVWGAGAWVTGEGWGSLVEMAQLGESVGYLVARSFQKAERLSANLPPAELIDVEVAVVGGGTAGAVSGLAAAGQGANTILCEFGGFLGGIGTGGGIHVYYYGVTGGLQDRIDELTSELTTKMGSPDRIRGFHPEAKKSALETLAVEAGLRLFYGWVVVDVLKEGDKVVGFLAAAPGKLFEVRASATVDSSGDGDVCASAGASFTMGREADGLCNVFSVIPGTRSHGACTALNFDAGHVDATDIVDLTRARRQGLAHLRRPEGFTPENRYSYISPLIGLRQSRQIVADYVLTVNDQVLFRRFPDAIAYGSCHLDDHKADFNNASDGAMFWNWGLGFWDRWVVHELPLRSLLPKGLDGIFIACRALGVTSEAANLFRMQRDMQRVGEAAGVAAALAAKDGVSTRNVDAAQVQEVLRSRGGMFEPEELWAKSGSESWKSSTYRQDLPVNTYPSVEELCRKFEQTWGSIILWQLCHDPEAGIPLLQGVLKLGGPNARWWAAAGLAMLGRQDGADVLLEAFLDQDETLPLPPDFPEWHIGWKSHTAPRWLTAVMLLGLAHCREAVKPIAAMLNEPGNDPIRYGTAVRALARIGDPAAAAALRQFLKRSDLASQRHEIRSDGKWIRKGMGYEVGWALRLSVVEALTAVGDPVPDAASGYLEHPEPTVRRYARRVWEEAVKAQKRTGEAALVN